MTQSNQRLHRERWARLRLQVIGHLLAAPPPAGQLRARLAELAQRTWRNPITGEDVRFGVSTLERWLALARKGPDPTPMLTARGRCDAGVQRSITAQIADAIRLQYAEHPSWTI